LNSFSDNLCISISLRSKFGYLLLSVNIAIFPNVFLISVCWTLRIWKQSHLLQSFYVGFVQEVTINLRR
jgi:hypothetical protein